MYKRPHTVGVINKIKNDVLLRQNDTSFWNTELPGLEEQTLHVLKKFGKESQNTSTRKRNRKYLKKKSSKGYIKTQYERKINGISNTSEYDRKKIEKKPSRPQTTVPEKRNEINRTTNEHLNDIQRAKVKCDEAITGTNFVKGFDDVTLEDFMKLNVSNTSREVEFKRTNDINGLYDKAASEIQRAFRGSSVRRRNKVHQILLKVAKDSNDIWIEVQDKQKGESWFYNKINGESRWTRPEQTNKNRNTLPLTCFPSITSNHSDSICSRKSNENLKADKNVLPFLHISSDNLQLNTDIGSAGIQRKQENEINLVRLGDSSIDLEESRKHLFSADGRANSQLRKAVVSALKSTRSDSELLSYRNKNNNALLEPRKNIEICRNNAFFPNENGKRIVSVIQADKKTEDKDIMNQKMIISSTCSKNNMRTSNLDDTFTKNVRDISKTFTEHNTVQKISSISSRKENIFRSTKQAVPCLNCWSVGKGKKCFVHSKGRQNPTTKEEGSILLCKNWDSRILWRRYRSEDIQEVFMKKLASMQYDNDHKHFTLTTSLKHPIYKVLSCQVKRLNFLARIKLRARYWFLSFVEYICTYKRSTVSSKKIQNKRSIIKQRIVCEKSTKLRSFHPRPPLTGSSFLEKRGTLQILFDQSIPIEGKRVKRKYIIIGPPPIPHALYQPRKYERHPPIRIALEDKRTDNKNTNFQVSSLLQTDSVVHIDTFPPPLTRIFAMFGRKTAIDNLAVGGLSAELMISQIVITVIPSQFSSFVIKDRISLCPEVYDDEKTILRSINVEDKSQKYVERPLQHLLDDRIAPTITVVVRLNPNNNNAIGANRPIQTGEKDNFGFRTSISADIPYIKNFIETNTFIPAHDVATLNIPRGNQPVITRANSDYPFREPSPHTKTTMDYYEILHAQGVCTSNKAQTFISSGKQNIGKFMRECDPNQPLGSFVSVVTKNWRHTKKTIINKYINAQGLPYWYNQTTGETFWEFPCEDAIIDDGSGNFSNSLSKTMCKNEKMSNRKHESDSRSGCELQVLGPGYETRTNLSEDKYESKAEKFELEKEWDSQNNSIAFKDNEKPTEVKEIDSQRENNSNEIATYIPSSISTSIGTSSLFDKSIPHEKHISNQRNQPEKDNTKEKIFTTNIQTTNTKPDVYSSTNSIINSIVDAVDVALNNVIAPKDMLKFGMGLGMTLNAQGLMQQNLTELNDQVNCDNTCKTIDKSKNDNDVIEGSYQQDKEIEGECEAEKIRKDHEVCEKNSSTKEESDNLFRGLLQIDSKLPPQVSEGNIDLTSQKNSEQKFRPLNNLYRKHESAGRGSRYIKASNAISYDKIKVSKLVEVRKSERSIPPGFLAAIDYKMTCKQNVDYLPRLHYMPNCKPVGRVKPRCAGNDWLVTGYDPWSEGKELLNVNFISNLGVKKEELEKNKTTKRAGEEPFFSFIDNDGLSEQSRKCTKQIEFLNYFNEMCSFVRHGKYKELEDRMNEPDWNLPIDYVDAGGNTLLSISCQNGNKRIAKLCLRKGSDINKQNLNGQTCLHYAFGYGFGKFKKYCFDRICFD